MKFFVLDNECNKEKKNLRDDTTIYVIENGNVYVEYGVYNNFMLVPYLKSNLLYVIQIANQGYKIDSYKEKCLIKDIKNHFKMVYCKYVEYML